MPTTTKSNGIGRGATLHRRSTSTQSGTILLDCTDMWVAGIDSAWPYASLSSLNRFYVTVGPVCVIDVAVNTEGGIMQFILQDASCTTHSLRGYSKQEGTWCSVTIALHTPSVAISLCSQCTPLHALSSSTIRRYRDCSLKLARWNHCLETEVPPLRIHDFTH